jgi:hypothetical protein
MDHRVKSGGDEPRKYRAARQKLLPWRALAKTRGRDMSKRSRTINLPPPYLQRVWIDAARVTNPDGYPFCLPFLRDGLDLSVDRAITIIGRRERNNRHCRT